ncbi:MAG TPA: WYL domain-containing protein [Thermoanaerobaculia bacterium]|nr:WYL domain-containing protein [Thermoanaerobaculia bacterium]
MLPARPGRLLALVNFLNGRRSRSPEEIAERFDISKRTAYRDLRTLQDAGVPVANDDHGYRLLETARLPPLAFTAAERAVLRLALSNPVLGRHPGLRKVLAGLRSKLDAADQASAESPEALALATVDRSGPNAERHLDALRQAIEDQATVELRYRSLTATTKRPRPRRVDPLRVFHRAGAWYLAGHCHRNDEPRTFRLDRIEALRPTDLHFDPPSFDLDAYLEHTWEIFRGKRRHDVVLRFDPTLAPLLHHARHHHGETVQETVDGDLEYRVTLSHLDEIARWTVGFGGRCRVVEPEELERRVRELAEGVLGV